ncbi:hypothetical protein FPF71_07660 [Algibacter amylolyticus]|uniref:Lipoprotein n=1 Tax=Algibacter amylolyticus TaxID=1608400 RepID=A0A5M7BC52_9FLAO|nr:hypothetical protein [Algibacter amylolyticus]KAA5825064.1 hypothetical protein F2B50_07660 [Algibacter amylolyticus]MBB5268831.1 hypothetical protein [Algibacter amylolyticus]TSJ77558.1 hypothetical protein FPF71_07660 [Algibacter amylolyticus]
MTNFRILILILVFGLISCSEKKKKAELKQVESQKTVDKEKYDRFWITYEYPNNFSEKVEVYISKENDTILNQVINLKNGIIDSTKSRFFQFNLVKSEKTDTYNGIFKYYSDFDSNPKNVNKEKTLSLSIFQKSRDSSYYQTFESKASNQVEFELVNYESDQLVGIMSERRFIQFFDENGKDMLNFITTEMAVDNKPKTHNIGIEIYELNKKR